MGIAIPQVVTEDRASGAQVIDGSLKFNGGYLTRTPSSNGNRRIWTYSAWVKFDNNAAQSEPLLVAGNSSSDFTQIFTYKTAASDIAISAKTGSSDKVEIASNNLLRDTGWYHIVAVFDSTGSGYQTDSTIYVNGVEISRNTNTFAGGQNYQSWVNSTAEPHYLGYLWNGNTFKGEMSQVYLIDGQALGPENFGYTDPLTNTWRPKKFSGNFTVSNPSAINDGTDWNSYFTGDYDQNHSWGTLYQSSHAFDGDLNTKAIGQANGTGLTWTAPGGAIGANATTIRIYGNDDACPDDYLKINGTNYGGLITQGFTAAWTVLKGSGAVGGGITQLESIYLRDNSAGNQHYRWAALEIDGVILVANQNDGFTGTNSFYLPMDGNSPIGEDKSGGGNNWTPVNFGGSVALDNPQVSGARPILNVTQGGTQAGVGVFGSELNQTIEVTVSNASGNNRYYFDGSLTPNLAFTRGSTITFHTTNNGNVSGDGHPFKLSSTNASGSAGTEYTDGVAYYINGSVVSGSDYVSNYSGGAASGFRGIKWTVPHNQSTTYYYCTIHTGMGNNGALTSTIDETKADPYAWKSVLALPLVGSANDVSNSVNSGSTTKTITVSGAAADSTDSNFYNGSFVFDGSNDQLSCAASADFNFGSSDFTLEAWLNMDTIGSSMAISEISGQSSASSPYGQWYFSTSTGWQWYHSSSNYAIISKDKVPTNKWFHLALVRNGNTLKHYLDGVEQASSSYTRTDAGKSDAAWIIGQQNSSSYFDGHIQDYRIYNGVAKYTSDFVVPATSPDILPDTPSGVSGGSKLAKVTDGAVSFDGSGDSLSIPDNADFDFGTGDFTVELFTYNDLAQSSNPVLIGATGGWYLQFKTGGTIVEFYTGSTSIQATGLGLEGGWHHIAVTKASNVVKIFIDGILKSTTSNSDTTNLASTLYIGNLNGASLHYLGFISNVRIVKGTALYTTDFTPPTAPLTNVTNTKLLCCQSNTLAGSAAVSPNLGGLNNGTQWSYYTTTTKGTGGSKDFYATGNDANHLFDGNTSLDCYGGYGGDGTNSDIVFSPPGGVAVSSKLEVYVGYYSKIKVNGSDYNTGGQSTAQAWVTVSDGSNFTGTLNTLILENTSNANVVRAAAIRINDTTVLLDPVSPEGNAAATNFNPFTTDINAVRGQETGYATLNPLSSQGTTLSDGNLTYTGTSNNFGTNGATSGKWFWEVSQNGTLDNSSNTFMVGVTRNTGHTGTFDDKIQFYSQASQSAIYKDSGSAVETLSGTTLNGGDIVGVALDIDSGTVQFYKNGIPIGSSVALNTGDYTWTPSAKNAPQGVTFNFGQKPFKFPPPAGFQPLNAANVKPVKVFARPDQYVGIITYVGSGATKTFTGLNFGDVPDLVWMKNRDRTSYGDGTSAHHFLYDTVRGTGTGKMLTSSTNEAEGSKSTEADLDGFVKNGFRLDAASGTDCINNSGDDFVAWCWKAGGNKNTFNVDDVGYASAAAAGLGAGTLTISGASVGTKQGFSIIKYAGSGSNSLFPHGLTQAPDFYIIKCLDVSAENWRVYHSSLGATKALTLNSSSEASTSNIFFNDTEPTSTVASVYAGYDGVNNTGRNYIAYCWHDVPGLQKFGSYAGSSGTTFVNLGFRPALLVIKFYDGTAVGSHAGWKVIDNQRNKFNISGIMQKVAWDVNEAENGGTTISTSEGKVDFLSNGFRILDNHSPFNTSGRSYIYMAWAESPTFNLYGGQSNAR